MRIKAGIDSRTRGTGFAVGHWNAQGRVQRLNEMVSDLEEKLRLA